MQLTDVFQSASFRLLLLSNVFLFLLVFGMSASVEKKNLKAAISNKFAIYTGIFLQFFVLPFLGFIAVKIFSNEFNSSAVSLTLLVVTSSPGGSFSNWWCSLFNADLGLSVTMTAISTIFSMFMLPGNLVLYATLASVGDEDVIEKIDWTSLFTSLIVVISAILLGLSFSYRDYSARKRNFVNRLGMLSGIFLMAFGFFLNAAGEESSDAQNTDEAKVWDKDWGFYVGVAFPCVTSIILSTILGSMAKLTKPERVTVAVECSYQNPGIATSVALAMFTDPTERATALGVPLYYGFVEALVCGVYCLLCWKLGWTKASRNEKLWKVIIMSYEVEDDQEPNSRDNDNSDEEVGNFDDIEEIGKEKDAPVTPNLIKDKGDDPDMSLNTTRTRLFTGDTLGTSRTERLDSTDTIVNSQLGYDDREIPSDISSPSPLPITKHRAIQASRPLEIVHDSIPENS